MFEFFKGMIEKVGVKLGSDFTEKLIDFIKGIKMQDDEKRRIHARSKSNKYIYGFSIFEKSSESTRSISYWR